MRTADTQLGLLPARAVVISRHISVADELDGPPRYSRLLAPPRRSPSPG
jgi:hypothetical protein